MSILKKLMVAVLILSMLAVPIQAKSGNSWSNDNNNGRFKDVPTTYWAYNDIMEMVQRGILSGYTDSTFKPEATVTRAEFAKLMVLALDMDVLNVKTSTFADVEKGNWALSYIETSKPYLTGFRSNGTDYFKPSLASVREDMAVALVKALKKSVTSDLTVLDQFKDKDQISTNLRPYVATAVKEGIMKGDGNGNFGPQNNLTRAEAATLLLRVSDDEKVTYDEEKVTYDTTLATPVLALEQKADGLTVKWSEVAATGFQYYKVVLSKTDSTPSYPDNGYAVVISNVKELSTKLLYGSTYNDIKLNPGDKYYVAITAVYSGDKRFTSNVKTFTVPDAVVTTPTHSATTLAYNITDGKVKLGWTKADTSKFVYYKVVVSKSDSTPSYPDNGYQTYTSEINAVTYDLSAGMKYEGGDIGGKLVSGETYYIAITTVYEDLKVTSNVIKVVLP